MSLIIITLALFIPIIMTIFGIILWVSPPDEINSLVGYRSKQSMSSQQAWDYAQSITAKSWTFVGIIITICSYLLLNLLTVTVDIIIITLISLQILIWFTTILWIERKLKTKIFL